MRQLATTLKALVLATSVMPLSIWSSWAQQEAKPPATAAPVAAKPVNATTPTFNHAGKIERLSGVWIEGPGYDITYGGNYESCAARCLAAPKCTMIEYYRPEKKCNLYDAVRPRKTGGSSDVGIRR